MNKKKWVYEFGPDKTDGNKDMSAELGGKGSNLAEMSSLKLPVPPGFTIITEACASYYELENKLDEELKKQVLDSISSLEKQTGKKIGCSNSPLLVSVRSGAPVSMPGMMDTVLNLGLNPSVVEGISQKTNNPRFAWDSYRRFIQMYADVVMGINTSILDSVLEDLKEAREVQLDTELTADDFKELSEVYKNIISNETGLVFPDDPEDQLWSAIEAVFGSWQNQRAIKYRELNNISHKIGTAVNIQSMVFGNTGDNSATGVCFTRDPSTGDKKFFGEYLVNAQGEDVVAGIRTPWPINQDSMNDSNCKHSTLEELMPKVFKELTEVYQKLELHYKDMQDIEFTVEDGKLYLLQTRSGKRTAAAAIKIMIDLVAEGVLSQQEALMKIEPETLNQLLHPRIDPDVEKKVIAIGLPASPGAVSGEIAFSPEVAVAKFEAGKDVILVRKETSPEDIAGMASSKGILTARGGMTSHAAVVARGMGKACVVACSTAMIDYNNKVMLLDGKNYSEGDFLTIDGGNGEVIAGKIPTIEGEISEDFSTFMSWADKERRLNIRANADSEVDSKVALKFGAKGIGLCRTEHMFFDPERILAVREMIFAQDKEEREVALQKILPFQRDDFISIFKAMNGYPVNIRLLDPPLHEFLPHEEKDKINLTKSLDIAESELEERISSLHEFNPMLGHRGCRLGVSYPEIYRVQVRAIIEAAIEVKKDGGVVLPEIMIPLISIGAELLLIKEELEQEVKKVLFEQKQDLDYKLGTMIELPRAAITAGSFAKNADFFSFGTNDLTQTTYGLSRDDAGKFLPEYLSHEIMPIDPFVSIDVEGVGYLVKIACEQGKKANPDMHLGICGEHGGENKSIQFFHDVGLDYISCSPYRVPVARLAAAQAAIRSEK